MILYDYVESCTLMHDMLIVRVCHERRQHKRWEAVWHATIDSITMHGLSVCFLFPRNKVVPFRRRRMTSRHCVGFV